MLNYSLLWVLFAKIDRVRRKKPFLLPFKSTIVIHKHKCKTKVPIVKKKNKQKQVKIARDNQSLPNRFAP